MIFGLVRMSKTPIHQNLSTSFVNLSALVRHLRVLQFVGTVEIELSSYEAEIDFLEDGSVKAREQDHIAGRLSFGDDALQRIMIRSKEPGGVINVYRNPEAVEADGVFVDEEIVEAARRMAAVKPSTTGKQGSHPDDLDFPVTRSNPIPKPGHLFDADTVENWSELVSLLSELMRTVDGSLAKGGLEFAEVFRNACGFVSFDHPFLDPETDIFSYNEGYISLRQKVAARELIGGITSALARIMHRLREDPYYNSVLHLTMHRVRVLANRRGTQLAQFGLDREIQKITGI